MATRSTIAVAHEDGSVSVSYCHWDGYLDHNGQLLVTNYNTLEKAEALVALGSISSLAASIEKPEGHSFDDAVKGYTVFYGRDRGEDGTEPKKFNTVEAYFKKNQGEEFNYLFRNGKWECDSYGDYIEDVAEELERIREDEHS